MVRVRSRDLVGVLRGALRAGDLEREILQMQLARTESRVADLEGRERVVREALQILFMARGRMSPLMMRGLLVDLPTTADGRLDEVEFAGRVFDATVEAAREVEMRSQA
jgi:hypothetical protein